MELDRSAGILLHPTSLPGGRLGRPAFQFVDWLAEAGQSWWQILPLGPPDASGSPYAAASAFAGWNGLLARPHAAVSTAEVERFVAEHPYWIGHWAEFAGEGAIADQVRFEREWGELRRYAADRGVRLIGDLPIYVANGGADHRAWPELFQRGVVAGVPPDDWSATGQLWGNPVYSWEAMRRTGYRWWIERFRRTFELLDVTRVDHFRGFVAYWAVSARAKTAKRGRWRQGPGRRVFDAVAEALGDLPVIAEDLGLITPAVESLRDELRLPGMVVLQFAFTTGLANPAPLDRSENRVAYTGTHDNDTTIGWWTTISDEDREAVRRAAADAGIVDEEPNWQLIRLAYDLPARLAIVPMQDVLGLGSEARMNTPGRAEGNWSWRLDAKSLSPDLAKRLREAAQQANR